MRAKLNAVKTEMRRRSITRSPNRDAGSPASCKGTTTTTQCPTTAGPCAASDDGSSGTGDRRFRAAVRKARSPGSGSTASLRDGYPNPGSCTPGRPCASTPKPEGGAQCVNAHAGICAGGAGQPASLPECAQHDQQLGGASPLWRLMAPTTSRWQLLLREEGGKEAGDEVATLGTHGTPSLRRRWAARMRRGGPGEPARHGEARCPSRGRCVDAVGAR